MKQKSKVRQSTGKPLIGEMRMFTTPEYPCGIVMVWTGTKWIIDTNSPPPPKLENKYKELWEGKK